MSGQELTTIRGYVQALAPGGDGEEAARVAVITDNGDEYHVVHKGVGVELADDINANVEVTGSVSELARDDADDDAPGMLRRIAVKSYRLTDGFDDPWYDDSVS